MAAVMVPCTVLAQPPHWPSADEMTHARQTHPFPPLERLNAQPPRAAPRIQSDQAPARSLDIAVIARQGAALSSQTAVNPNASRLQIFITLAIPQPSLERLVEQASRTGATLVLRGLKAQSLRETLAAVRPLIEAHPVAWVIDPEAFARYQVTLTPTFVLTLIEASKDTDQAPCGSACATPTSFVSVVGDVSVDYALDAIARQRPTTVPTVTALLKRLRDL